jgi:flavorubredoxin
MTDEATTIDEIAADTYRINTPVALPSGNGFNFNQYLIVDDEPLLFHTGLRRLFPAVRGAIARVMPVEKLRHISFSHFEADECGALNQFLEAAPQAAPLCGRIAAMVSINDFADRPARIAADGEIVNLGRHRLRWLDVPHLPHGWESGLICDLTTKTLFCGDLLTQGGAHHKPVTEADILGPSEAFRGQLDYYTHHPQTGALLARLAAEQPTTLACMHGSAWRGDGGAMIRALAASVGHA